MSLVWVEEEHQLDYPTMSLPQAPVIPIIVPVSP